jgi:hypothetical protein
MVNTNILHNIAMQNGGGLSIQTGALKAKIRIKDSRFLSNTANPVLQTRCLDRGAEYEPVKHIGKGGGISILKIKGIDVYSRTLENFESAKSEVELDSDGFMLDIAISDSDFEDNHAASAGGAFFLSASWEDTIKQYRGEMLVLAGCKICDNHAKFGGGLYVSRGASLNLTASRTHRPNSISGNSAREGGGVYLANAEFHVLSDRTFKITGNNATAKGGGISVGCSHLVCAGANSNACGGKIKIRKDTQLDRMCQTLLNLTEGLCFYEIQDYACPGPYTSLVFPEPGRIEKNTAGGSAPDIYVPVDVSDAVRRPNIDCEAGSYSNPAKGSFASYTTSCLLCPRGWHQDEVGQDTCRICEVGTFSAGEGSVKCSICEHGRFQSARAATSPCKVCEREGEITNNIRSGCQKPPWRIKSDCSHTQFLNDSWNNKSDYECVECPLGASCVGNINTSGIRAKFGWSRCPMQHNASVIPTFERCQFKGSCLGARNHELQGQFEGPNNADLALCRDIVDQTDDNYSSSSLGGINNVCRHGCNVEAGYRKDGRQCAACESGFSHGDLSGRCDKCPEEGVNIGLTILGILIGVVGAVVIVKITIGDSEAISLGNADSADAIKAIGLSFVQVFTLLTTFPIQWPAIFTFLFQIGGTVTVLGEHRKLGVWSAFCLCFYFACFVSASFVSHVVQNSSHDSRTCTVLCHMQPASRKSQMLFQRRHGSRRVFHDARCLGNHARYPHMSLHSNVGGHQQGLSCGGSHRQNQNFLCSTSVPHLAFVVHKHICFICMSQRLWRELHAN